MDFVTPLNITARDSDESVVSKFLDHDFSDPKNNNKLCLVKWLIEQPPGGTWENRETLNDVEAFHHFCAAKKLNAFLPKSHRLWEASMPSTQRRTAAQLKMPEPQDMFIGPGAGKEKRGRPVTKTSMDIAVSVLKQGAVDPGKKRHRTKRARQPELRQRNRLQRADN